MTINEASARTPVATPSTVPAYAGNHQIKPLKFAPARLEGLSERLITSHHENNYAGSVKTLNALRPRLAAALADTEAPPAIYGGLKREELHRTGSVVLHEIYFDGMGGDGRAAGSVRDAIDAAFGSICMNTAFTWITAPKPPGISTRGSRTSTGKRPTAVMRRRSPPPAPELESGDEREASEVGLDHLPQDRPVVANRPPHQPSGRAKRAPVADHGSAA